MADTERATDNFWKAFRERAAELAAVKSADEPVYDFLLERLHEVDPGLFLELSINEQPCELTISADGNRELFPLARSVVAAAPAVDGWTIRALKPKQGFPEGARFNEVSIKTEGIVFQAFESDEDPRGIHLLIFIPGITEEEKEDAHNAVLRLLDHALGEEELALGICETDVAVLADGAQPEDAYTLVELPALLNSRAQA